MSGGSGRDTFLLGLENNEALYDSQGFLENEDYALIKGFTLGEDTIDLFGEPSDYVLAPSPEGLPGGTGIYLDREQDELIGIVEGDSALTLDSNAFRFV